MHRVGKGILDQCTSRNCLVNELIVLPVVGDAGFEAYFDHKAHEIHTSIGALTPEEQGKLMLAYPSPDSNERMIFERFFESPQIIARNGDFEGCFAIDVTAYIHREQHDRFTELMAYIRNAPKTVFVLFIYSDNSNEINSMLQHLTQFGFFRLLSIPLPTPQDLSSYTMHHIRDFSLHILASVEECLLEFFSTNTVGYEVADYITRQLKNADYHGDLDTVESLLKEMKQTFLINGLLSGFGY